MLDVHREPRYPVVVGSDLRVKESEAGAVRCSYCRVELAASATWECPRCSTRHHLACASEHGACTVLGCGAPFFGHEHWSGWHFSRGPVHRHAMFTVRDALLMLALAGLFVGAGAMYVVFSPPQFKMTTLMGE